MMHLGYFQQLKMLTGGWSSLEIHQRRRGAILADLIIQANYNQDLGSRDKKFHNNYTSPPPPPPRISRTSRTCQHYIHELRGSSMYIFFTSCVNPVVLQASKHKRPILRFYIRLNGLRKRKEKRLVTPLG